MRFFWNNYLENRDTHYQTGDLLDLEFAVSERIGRFQVGVTGFYAFQVEDDELLGCQFHLMAGAGRMLSSAQS